VSRIQQLAKTYGQHIATSWQRTIAGSQRIIMIVYDKELERDILAHKTEFEIVTKEANHDWFEVDFTQFVAGKIGAALERKEVTETSVVAVSGVGALFGFTRVSQILKIIESSIRGRLVVFFPGQYEQNNYRLLDARDGWNYLAVPITLNSVGLS
jgi:hypothetical protein